MGGKGSRNNRLKAGNVKGPGDVAVTWQVKPVGYLVVLLEDLVWPSAPRVQLGTTS